MTSPKWLLRAVSMLTTAKLWARSKKGLNRLSQPPNLTKRTCVNLKATTESEIHPELHDQVKIISVLGIIWTYSFGAKLSSSYANEQSLQRKSNSPPPPAPKATRRQRENYKHRQRVGGHWSAFKKGHHKGSNHQTFTFTFILMVHASPRNRSLFQTEMKLSWSSFRLTLLVQLHSQIPPSLPFCLSPSSIPSEYSVYFINPCLEYFCVTLLTKTSTMGLFYQPQNGLVTRVLYVTAWNRNSYYSQLTAIWLLFPCFPLTSEPTDLFRDLLFYEWMKWQFGLGIGDAWTSLRTGFVHVVPGREMRGRGGGSSR